MSQNMISVKIKEVIANVERAEWILPTFQRKYVWDQEQICDLFDSIMRSYPISTFMIWKVEREAAAQHTFYKFITHYQEWWRELGEEFAPSSLDYYYAVIDGQQRINSLYIGYCGSYAVKLPRKHWKNAYDESIQPKTFLYLNLLEDAGENSTRVYDFRFFSKAEMDAEENKTKWYKVGDILAYPHIENDDIDDKLEQEIDKRHIFDTFTTEERRTAFKKMRMLYKKTFHTGIVNYYQEDNQSLERVVDIFLRTNGGGTALAFSDLVMSVTTRQWGESKDKIEELIKLIYAETGIVLNKDFVLKVFLMLYSKDIQFKVMHFEDPKINLVAQARDNYDDIYKCILGACQFVEQIGLNNDTLRSKYALIPIVYYCYKNKFEINNVAKKPDNRKLVAVWLKIALLKGLFGGKPDAVLSALRTIIDKNPGDFPTQKIIDHYTNSNKDLRIDREFIEDKVAKTHYGSIEAYLLLSLATDLDPQQRYNVDHMYPKDMFKKNALNHLAFLQGDSDLRSFYENKENWNTLGNLQLLNDSENKSKNKSKLETWSAAHPQYKLSNYCVPTDSTGAYIISDNAFKTFVEERRTLMVDAIMRNLTT